MPLTRERTKYIATNDTVFLPSVAIDSTLGVRGNSVFDGSVSIFNNLGIRTANPTSVLHVNGDIRLVAQADGQPIKINGRSSDNFSQLAFYQNDGSTFSGLLQYHGDTTIAFVQNSAYATKGTSLTERMRIDSSGNVGIGSSPLSANARLTVSGNRTFLIANNEVYALGLMYATGLGQYYIGASNSATPDLVFSNSSGTERLRIANDGRITGSTAVLDIPYQTNAQTAASYSVQASDSGKIIEMNNAGANTVTVPNLSTVATGAQITIIQTGAGQTTIAAGSNTTVNATPGLKLRAQWSTATLIKRTTGATDVWIATGDLTA